MLKRSFALTKNIFFRLRHDKRTLFLIVIIPILIMCLFGFTFAGEPENVKVIIVNSDSGLSILKTEELGNITLYTNTAQTIIEHFDAKILDLTFLSDIKKAKEEVKAGKAWAVIYFPKNFSQDMMNRFLIAKNQTTWQYEGTTLHLILDGLETKDAELSLIIDGSNSQVSAAIIGNVNKAFLQSVEEDHPGMSFSNAVKTDYLYGENARFIDFFAPGIIGLVVTIITIMLTIVSFVRERISGTLDRLIVSPTKTWEIILGYTMAFTTIAVLQSIELLAVAILLFNISFEGNILIALGLIVLYAVGLLGLGTLLSTLAKNEFQAVQFIPLIILPSFILAGIFWPIESMPPVMRPLSTLVPLTYVADALRSVMIRGWGIEKIMLDLIALAIFAVATILLSVVALKRRG